MINSLDQDSKLVQDLAQVDRLLEKEDLVFAVFRGMNNYIRTRFESRAPSEDEIREMIDLVKEEKKEAG